MHAYKAASTHTVRSKVNSEFAWQRNYYEHIIRNDESLNRIRHYIQDNLANWQFDRENPAATNLEAKDAWRTQITGCRAADISLQYLEVKHGQLLGKYDSQQ
jgi:hypothetical protein